MPLVPHSYDHDGLTLVGQLARPAGRARGAVLVVHEINGLADNARRRAEMLADLGYVALAADLYGGGETFEGDAARARMEALLHDRATLRARVRAGLDALATASDVDPTRLGAIGYCFGGGVVLELARSGARLAGVVSFHGLLSTDLPAKPGEVQARVLACHGARDPLVPWDDVDMFQAEMEAADADWQLLVFGRARHAFTNPNAHGIEDPALAHDPAADRQSWAAMQAFLDEAFDAGA